MIKKYYSLNQIKHAEKITRKKILGHEDIVRLLEEMTNNGLTRVYVDQIAETDKDILTDWCMIHPEIEATYD